MDLASKKCVPCEIGQPPMTREETEDMLNQLNSYSSSESEGRVEKSKKGSSRQARTINEWELLDENGKFKIRKKFKFDTYMDGIDFVNKIAKVAEEQDHHPDLEVGWRRITVNFMTHNIGGLSENDFVMAAKIDNL